MKNQTKKPPRPCTPPFAGRTHERSRQVRSRESESLFPSTKNPSDTGLGDLPEGHERPAATPATVEPAVAELADVVSEARIRNVEAAARRAPAVIVLGDGSVVARETAGLAPCGERARVAMEAQLTEVGADRFGRDPLARLELGLPDHHLELLATAADRLAVEAAVEVPLLVVESR